MRVDGVTPTSLTRRDRTTDGFRQLRIKEIQSLVEIPHGLLIAALQLTVTVDVAGAASVRRRDVRVGETAPLHPAVFATGHEKEDAAALYMGAAST